MLIVAALAGATRAPVSDWLSTGEHEFFKAHGVKVKVDREAVVRYPSLHKLPEVSAKADGSLRDHIEQIVKARATMGFTPQDKARMNALLRQGEFAMRSHLSWGAMALLLGADPFDLMQDTAGGLLRFGGPADRWDFEREWLERRLKARAEIDGRLEQITRDLALRAGSRPTSDLAPKLGTSGNQLIIQGKVGAKGFTDPVLLVRLHQAPLANLPEAEENAMNLAARRGRGGINSGLVQQRRALVEAQQATMNQPIQLVEALPTLKPGAQLTITLGIPLWMALRTERVELRLWSGEGWFQVDQLPGHAEAQDAAERSLEHSRQEVAKDTRNLIVRNGGTRNLARMGGLPRRRPGGLKRSTTSGVQSDPAATAKRMIDLARQLQKQGNWSKAFDEWEQLAEEFPDSPLVEEARKGMDAYPAAQLAAAKAREAAKDVVHAARAYNELIDRVPDSPEAEAASRWITAHARALTRDAEAQVAQGRKPQAIDILRQVVDRCPDTPEAESAARRIRQLQGLPVSR